MSQLQLFKIIEIIIRKYSKTAPRFLIENYLRLKIIYNLPAPSLENFLSSTNLSPGVISVFTKRTQQERHVNFSCVVIDHPQLPTITHKIIEQIPNCIVLDQSMNQSNNILGKGESDKVKDSLTKAIIFRSHRQNFEVLSESLDSYLSICELFHGHIHLTVNCFESPSWLDIKEHMTTTQGDEFEGVVQDGYFRILEERGSRITLDELSEICEIQRTPFGQMLVFEGGHDGIMVWITQKYLPKLGYSPNVAMPANRSKQYILFQSTPLGFKVFKRRQMLKQKMHVLNFTTVIFNMNQYTPSVDKAISTYFDQYCRNFFSGMLMKSEFKLLQENVRHGERICDILGIDKKKLLLKLLQL